MIRANIHRRWRTHIYSLLLLPFIVACGNTTVSKPPPSPSLPAQLTTVPNTGPSGLPFYDPQGLCFDPQGNLYVADASSDQGYYRLLKLSSDGHLLAEWHYFQRTFNGSANGPIYVACDQHGNIYVDDASQSRIIKLSSTGKFIAILGTPGQFEGVNVLTLDTAGDLYVAEYYQSRIEKFAPTGQLLTVIPLPQTSDSHQPTGPIGIAVDTRGTIYLADQRNSRILHLSAAGELLQVWGKEGSDPGQFNHPGVLALDSQGNFYVGDDYNYRIEKFSSQGKLLALWHLPQKNVVSFNTGPGPLAINAQDILYVSDTDANVTTWFILRYSLSGKLLSRI